MPRHENRPQRRGATRDARPRLLIVVGSLRTEQDYLIGLRDSVDSPSVDIKIVPKAKSPLEVVRFAEKYRAGSTGDFEEVWCVYDVDEFEVEEARRLAVRSKYSLAVSDPCFELWLLLHHEDCDAFQSGYKDVARRLKKYVVGYDKTKLAFADYADGVVAAIRRAEKLGETGNPSTGVWRLARRIRDEEAQ